MLKNGCSNFRLYIPIGGEVLQPIVQTKAEVLNLLGSDKPVLGHVSITEPIIDIRGCKVLTGFLQDPCSVLKFETD